jgi:hypothetical protein
MRRLRLVVAAVLAAATLGTAAAVAVPSASAAPRNDCNKLYQRAQIYYNVWELLHATGYGQTQTAFEVLGKALAAEGKYLTCIGQ